MATESKRWPNNCEWARMDAIAMAIRARNCMKLAMVHITDAESLRNLFEATECMREIELKLTVVRGTGPLEEK